MISRIKPDQYDPTPITEGLYMARFTDGRTQTNVPHAIVRHSPTGFEWGYGGSGPAELALNTCHAVLKALASEGAVTEPFTDSEPHPALWSMYQDLKEQKLCGMDRAGGHIPYESLRRWVLTRYNGWRAVYGEDLPE